MVFFYVMNKKSQGKAILMKIKPDERSLRTENGMDI